MGVLLRLIWGVLSRFGSLFARLWAYFRSGSFAKWIAFYFMVYAGGIIGQIMKWLGISFVVSNFALPALTPLISTHLLGLPPDWGQFLALTKIDQATTIILSAAVIRAADRIQVKRNRAAWQTPL